MAEYIAEIMAAVALLTAAGTIWYNYRRSRTEEGQAQSNESRVALNGFGKLTVILQSEIDRLRTRVSELESKQITWEIERGVLLDRVQALEAENRRLREEMEQLKKGAFERHPQ